MRYIRLLQQANFNVTSHACQRLLNTSKQLSNNESTIVENKTVGSKILKVAIIGCPNAGKSTIINQIIRRRIFAISKKVHTTKCCARAVLNEGNCQIVFLDTPGLISMKEYEKYKLGTSYFKGGEDAILEADVIGVVHDVSNSFLREKLNPKVLRLLNLYEGKDSILILNKIDTLKSKRQLLDLSDILTNKSLRKNGSPVAVPEKLSEIDLQNIVKKVHYWEHFNDVFMLSALLGSGVDDLRNYFLKIARPGEWIFPCDTYTDKGPVSVIEEVVRAKLLEHLPQEIPYNLDVQLEYLDMDNEELITTVVLVHYSANRMERLIKGIGGKRIKMISSEAEQEIADAFLTDVHLQIVLKKKEKELSSFG